ncbi:ABC transporter ATP-binding protein [Membranihabitans maritimus]|uniref:ABC transporter ATP-binding protein n=1 Tax=Membranihabitans maritimus TaxID=2904244 RepID=UPI001F19F0DE|nr:ABC transporter ATP-binding protein [Membranihabitans maritimus]
MISVNNLSKSYFTDTLETLALNNITLHIEKGEFVSIMGPSGCGKSTLLNMIGLLDSPTEGVIRIEGQEFRHKKEKELARYRNQNLGFIFQSFHLISDLPVIDNVELPLLYRGTSARERRHKAEEALAQVELSHRIFHYPNQLSGGQRQRVAIARAIVGNPTILMADEPTGNLDSVLGDEVMKILMDLNQENNVTIVMVTHDENMAQKTHRIIRLYDGNLVN